MTTLNLCMKCGADIERDETFHRGALHMEPYDDPIWHGVPIGLTPTERAVLWSVVKADGAIVPKTAIIERLGWEPDYPGRCIDVMTCRIRHKMGVVAPAPIRNVRGFGLKLELA